MAAIKNGNKMKFIRKGIRDVVQIKPSIYTDDRGYFMESYNKAVCDQFFGQEIVFVQDNESKSSKNVLRGLHFQLPPFSQAKLVRVISGSVLDVAVDLRINSQSYGKYVKTILSADNKAQLFIPRGFAHGYLVLSDEATFSYKVDNTYQPSAERTLAWNDECISIDWGLNQTVPIISQKDNKGLSLKQVMDELKVI